MLYDADPSGMTSLHNSCTVTVYTHSAICSQPGFISAKHAQPSQQSPLLTKVTWKSVCLW